MYKKYRNSFAFGILILSCMGPIGVWAETGQTGQNDSDSSRQTTCPAQANQALPPSRDVAPDSDHSKDPAAEAAPAR